MLGRIQPVETTTHHRQCRIASIQGTGVGCAIYSEGQTAGDQQPPPAEFGRKLAGMVQPRPGGVATADHAQLVPLQ